MGYRLMKTQVCVCAFFFTYTTKFPASPPYRPRRVQLDEFGSKAYKEL